VADIAWYPPEEGFELDPTCCCIFPCRKESNDGAIASQEGEPQKFQHICVKPQRFNRLNALVRKLIGSWTRADRTLLN